MTESAYVFVHFKPVELSLPAFCLFRQLADLIFIQSPEATPSPLIQFDDRIRIGYGKYVRNVYAHRRMVPVKYLALIGAAVCAWGALRSDGVKGLIYIGGAIACTIAFAAAS